MGIAVNGDRLPVPTFEHPYEISLLVMCIVQGIIFGVHLIKILRAPANTRLSQMFRVLFALIFIDTILVSIHCFTIGAPIIEWTWVFLFGMMAVAVVISQLQILKTLTVMTKIITIPRITFCQWFLLAWYTGGCTIAFAFLFFLGVKPPPLLRLIHDLHFGAISIVLVSYETWNSVFVAYLIIRNAKRSLERQMSSTAAETPPIEFQASIKHQRKYKIGLVLYLFGQVTYLWVGMLGQMYFQSLPAELDPMLNATRIFVYHMLLWYPIYVYYFYALLTKVQFHERTSSEKKHVKQPGIIKKITILSPTIMMKSTIH